MRSAFDILVKRYAGWVIRYRLWVVMFTLAIVSVAASGLPSLDFSNNYRVFFSDENPELVAFETFQKTYTKNDNIMFVIQPRQGHVFTPKMAGAIEWLTAEAWKIPYAIRVDSVSNFQHSRAEGDDLIVGALIENGMAYTPSQFVHRRTIALNEPLLLNNLISPDAKTTGINVTIQYPEKSITEIPKAVAYARGLVSQLKEKNPDLIIVLSGISMLNNAFVEAGKSDAMSLVPLMYLLLIIMLALVLRSFAATLVTLLVIGFATVVAMGVIGHLGIKLNPISITAPTVIMTLAIADSIHVLVSMLGFMRGGTNKIDSLKESLRVNVVPVTVTSLTTIVGFLTLNFSDAPPFRDLGNITAMGILAAWMLSLLFLPALLSYLPVKVPVQSGLLPVVQTSLVKLADFIIRKWKPVLVVTGVISIALISLVPRIELNDQFVHYFDKRVEFRNDAEFAEKNLNGVYVLEYSIPAESAGGINEPEYLTILDKFTDWLRMQPDVMHVFSYSDVIKRLNKNMHADDQTWYRIPEQRNLAAQYLLLYELSLPYGLDLNDRISIDKSSTRVSVTIRDIPSGKIRQMLTKSDQWFAQHAPEFMWAKSTGATVMFSYISQRNVEGMLRGNLIALFVIALILILTLRSFSLGLLSLIPNAVPIFATFGIWAVLVGQVGMAAAIVTATSLGIIVDDTVHFLSKYTLARREKGFEVPEAIRYAFETVGTAIVMTTIVLTIGFGLLVTSSFLVNSQMGLLTAIAIIMALLTDFFLLPALLMSTYKPKQEKSDDLSTVKQTI